MGYRKFIVSNQKEEYISTQRVKNSLLYSTFSLCHTGLTSA